MIELKLNRNPAPVPPYKAFGYFHQLRVIMHPVQHLFQLLKTRFFAFHEHNIAKLVFKSIAGRNYLGSCQLNSDTLLPACKAGRSITNMLRGD